MLEENDVVSLMGGFWSIVVQAFGLRTLRMVFDGETPFDAVTLFVDFDYSFELVLGADVLFHLLRFRLARQRQLLLFEFSHPANAFAHASVKVVLYGVICPARQVLGDLCPAIPQ